MPHSLPASPAELANSVSPSNEQGAPQSCMLKKKIKSNHSPLPFLGPWFTCVAADVWNRIEYIVTASGGEALLLEASLIRQHQPPFNVLLKDDKRNCEIKLAAAAVLLYLFWGIVMYAAIRTTIVWSWLRDESPVSAIRRTTTVS